ncbi:PstS family phosphate ABC transporter substrate-binding protein [Sediminicurvatus halobius]|uniref:Phosphate-binding protein n=1 Tax=Sediminicurvatus halobius TaxID=2182432 RepID=A0A2U2N7R8_9GAMM|nr:PstS family phosphate ABC transporter substrate-binding protein [Spiribacter halobius]PWG65122.1 phosphate-binding protein [Spiribacter halobius]UEX78929.1 PstS family phosphate ABC transporter substrate-binding protein [Spiribacter halobius]
MQTWKTSAIAVAAIVGMTSVASAQEREQIRIVGSSTVYPFASYVVEEFGATTEFPTPVIESTGSGGGLRLFCEGVGVSTPDISNASRRMKPSEFDRCQENGVEEITEAKIGSDGIVMAQSVDNEPVALTREQILLAVAAQVPQDGELVDNPYDNWNQIDSSLPDREIEILGPPTTSGTRDAFEELVMEAASESAGYPEAYSDVRADGAYVDSGENDNLIVQRIRENTDAFGIFGYSFLEENSDTIEAATIDGVEPTPESISEGEYPVARSLWFYIKKAHEGVVPGIDEYVSLFMDDLMIGSDGLLRDIGLIVLPEGERSEWQERVANRVNLQRSDLE